MNKQKSKFNMILVGVFILFTSMQETSAQPNMGDLLDEGAPHPVWTAGIYEYQDFYVPAQPDYGYLYFRAEGADGGARIVKEAWGSVRFKVAGGSGSVMEAIFKIGNSAGEIPPGSLVRMIIGRQGETRYGQEPQGSGGGGGTAVLYKAPNKSLSEFELLVVAGGGGGAQSDCCFVRHTGQSARTGTSGGDGKGGRLNYKGGKDGQGGHGTEEGDFDNASGAGGGAFSAGGSGEEQNGGSGGGTDDPRGGTAGRTNTPSGWSLGSYAPGGFGYGGGGQGIAEKGGAGGGYSGGGILLGVGVGGGGGSYINEDLATSLRKAVINATEDPQDGSIVYQFINGPTFDKIIRFAKNTNKCIDVKNGGIYAGTNVQLWDCNQSNSQSWIYDWERIKFAKEPSQCLEIQGSTTKNGANVELWTCNNNAQEQKWIYDGVNQRIRSISNLDYCLDLPNGNTSNGTNIQLWKCTYTSNQKNQQWEMDWATAANITGSGQAIRMVDHTDKCIDVNGVIGTGNNIQLWNCNGTANQQWIFDDLQIKLKTAPNKCLDVYHSDRSNGTNVQLYDCNGTNAQKWIYDGFTHRFRSGVYTNKCLSIAGSNTDKGTNIELWDCNNSPGEQFLID